MMRTICQRMAAAAIAGLMSGPAVARTIDYDINQTTACIRFSTHVASILAISGTFTRFMGHITLDPDRPDSVRIDVVVDDGKIAAPVVEAKTLKSSAYLDHQHFPTIRFHSESAQMLPDHRFSLIGDLTIRGVTRRQVFSGTIMPATMGGVPVMRLAARSQLERSDFGMVAGGRLVSNEVTLNITTVLREP